MELERPTKNAERLEDETGVDLHREWAARPAPRRRASLRREGFDYDALKIFLILAGLTAGMALALRSLL